MPDIQLRFHRDMLVLSAPIDALLARQGVDAALDRQYLNLMEPDTIHDALQLEAAVGAQCIVTTTEDITQARLAHLNMADDAPRLAKAALGIANSVKPQHVLVEIGPCGLPLDPSSKSSLNENRQQYADAARAFSEGTFDALFLNGFTKLADLKCALMGVAQVCDKPVFASMTIGDPVHQAAREAAEAAHAAGAAERASAAGAAGAGGATDSLANGMLPDYPFDGYAELDKPTPPPLPSAKRTVLPPDEWANAVACMVDLGADVIGFETADPLPAALRYAAIAAEQTDLPLLAQLQVMPSTMTKAARGLTPLADIDEYTPDTMATAAVKLFGAGVQFLRATGVATPSYTGALAATVSGLDARR